jgi:hypothetical protein
MFCPPAREEERRQRNQPQEQTERQDHPRTGHVAFHGRAGYGSIRKGSNHLSANGDAGDHGTRTTDYGLLTIDHRPSSVERNARGWPRVECSARIPACRSCRIPAATRASSKQEAGCFVTGRQDACATLRADHETERLQAGFIRPYPRWGRALQQRRLPLGVKPDCLGFFSQQFWEHEQRERCRQASAAASFVARRNGA